MSLESFYGGKQGVSPIVKARFKYVDIDDPAYKAAKAAAEVEGKTIPESEVMELCFNNASYEQVWYGQLAIIDTTNKRNKNNGKLFRRVLGRTAEESAVDGGTLHGEYIGRIVGPSEGFPLIKMGSIEGMKKQIVSDTKNISDLDVIYPSADGAIVQSDIVETENIATLIADTQNTQLIPGASIKEDGEMEYEKGIHYSWVNIRNNIDGNEEDTYVYLGFSIPYTIFDLNFETKDWNDTTAPIFENKDDYYNGETPFYQKWNISIPRGVRGHWAGNIRRRKYMDFLNWGSVGGNEPILYHFNSIYRNENGDIILPIDLMDIKEPLENKETGEGLTGDSSILVYTFYYYTQDELTPKAINVYLGKIVDVEKINLESDGGLKILYSDGTEKTVNEDNKIRWIKSISYSSGVMTVKYNTEDTKSFDIPYITSMKIEVDPLTNKNVLKWFNTSNNEFIVRDGNTTNNAAFSFRMVDGLRITPENFELQYHMDPPNATADKDWTSAANFQSFNEPVYLNTLEDTFISANGSLYVYFSSAAMRYDGSNYDNANPVLNINGKKMYFATNSKGEKWAAGGDLPIFEDTDDPQKMKWWKDLGLVKNTARTSKIAQDFNLDRLNAILTYKNEDIKDGDVISEADILNYLNNSSIWSIEGNNYSPYFNGHIYKYNLGWDTSFTRDGDLVDPEDDTIIEADDMGSLIFYKGYAFYYDFGAAKEWKSAGAMSSSDASMQLKIKLDDSNFIPSEDIVPIHKNGFFFLVNENSDSQGELPESIWSVDSGD